MADRTVKVILRANADQFQRELLKAKAAVKAVGDEIDTTNDRAAWMAQGVLALAPAAVTMGATAMPVLAGIATQATVAGAAIGTIALAFNGVGDALGALNDYQLDPTAKNLAKVNEALAKIGPDGAEFVRFLDEIGPKWAQLGMAARGGMFPGLQTGLALLTDKLPQFRRIVTEISEGVGQLGIDAGQGLSGGEFDEFFAYLENEAKPILVDFGRTLGNFADGFASLMVAFGPLTADFSGNMLDASRGFEAWAEGLSSTEGFQEFVDYVRANGPDVAQMLGAFGDALVEIAKAAAPVGAIMVPALEALADVVAAVADTPLGQFAILGAALTSLYGRVAALRSIAGGPLFAPMTKSAGESAKATRAALGGIRADVAAMAAVWGTAGARTEREQRRMAAASASLRSNVKETGKAFGPAAGQAALFATAMSPLPDKMGLTNTVMGAMLGSVIPGWGTAIGAAAGLALDFAQANNEITDAIESANDAMEDNNLAQMQADYETLVDEIKAAQDTVDQGGDGFWDFIDDGTSVDDARARWERIGEGILGIESSASKAADKAKELDAAIGHLTVSQGAFAHKQRVAKELDQQRAAAEETAWSFVNLAEAYRAPTLTLKQLMGRMRQYAQAQESLGKNIRKAIENGADPAALQKIIKDLGPAAGLAIEQLANGGTAAARRLNRSWHQLEGGTNDVIAALMNLNGAIVQLPDGRTIKINVQAAQAKSEIADIIARAQQIPRTIRTDYIVNQINRISKINAGEAGPGVGQRADGGFSENGVLKFADGGYGEDGRYYTRTPQIVPGGANILWGEEETGWEAYISGKPGMRDRNLAVLAEAAARLGASVTAFADGGAVNTRSSRLPALGFANLPAINLAASSFARLNAALKASEKALTREKSQRDAIVEKMTSLRGDVTAGLRSELFGERSPWSSGGGYESAIATLRGDIAKGRDFKADIATLRRKGLNGGALDELLRADPAMADEFARRTRGQLAEYERFHKVRASVSASAGSVAGSAAWGPDLRTGNRQRAALIRRIERLEATTKREHREDRRSSRKGAGRAARTRSRGYLR